MSFFSSNMTYVNTGHFQFPTGQLRGYNSCNDCHLQGCCCATHVNANYNIPRSDITASQMLATTAAFPVHDFSPARTKNEPSHCLESLDQIQPTLQLDADFSDIELSRIGLDGLSCNDLSIAEDTTLPNLSCDFCAADNVSANLHEHSSHSSVDASTHDDKPHLFEYEDSVQSLDDTAEGGAMDSVRCMSTSPASFVGGSDSEHELFPTAASWTLCNTQTSSGTDSAHGLSDIGITAATKCGLGPKQRVRKAKKPKSTTATKRGRKLPQLYQYLLDNLEATTPQRPNLIQWTNREALEFRVVDSEALSKRWGEVKTNKDMTYQKMSRAMRLYYDVKKHAVPLFTRHKPNNKMFQFNSGSAEVTRYMASLAADR